LDLNNFLIHLSEWLGVVAVVWILRLSPNFRLRPVAFKYPRREGYVALALFALILAGAFAYYSWGGKPGSEMDVLWQRLMLSGLIMLPFIAALLIRGQPPRSTGWDRSMLVPSLRLGLALAFLTIFLRGKIFAIINGVNTQDGYYLLAWAGICLAEETIFRGYLQLRLGAWLGDRWGWLASAGMFVLWQIPRIIVDPASFVTIFVLAAGQGLVLGWLARNSGHVLSPVIYRMVSEWAVYIT
jgi:membrane protease YdiL (CAAX protease family)